MLKVDIFNSFFAINRKYYASRLENVVTYDSQEFFDQVQNDEDRRGNQDWHLFHQVSKEAVPERKCLPNQEEEPEDKGDVEGGLYAGQHEHKDLIEAHVVVVN